MRGRNKVQIGKHSPFSESKQRSICQETPVKFHYPPHSTSPKASLSWLLLFAALLASCASAQNRSQFLQTPTSTSVVTLPAASQGCGRIPAIPPGSSADQTIPAVPALAKGHSTRSFRVHVPKGYGASRPQAVVIAFHGHGGNAADMEKSTGFSTLADEQDFLAIYPQGLLDDGGQPFWASIGPIADDGKIDDVRFVGDMLDAVQSIYCVDLRRVFATGFSNGGGMTAMLACRLAQRIAAFAPVSGNYYDISGGCSPARPVPILAVHGTADRIVPYNGISVQDNPEFPLPSIPTWLGNWAHRDGCKHGPLTFLQSASVTGIQWTDCQSNAIVAHYRIEGGGHIFPATIDTIPATLVLWHFFQSHPLTPSR
jgi:polyhydroxybutyrate depolymerase